MKDIVTYDKLVQVMGIQNNQAIFWGIVAAMLLIGVVQTLAEAYFAITVGSVSKLHKLGIGGPVLIFFAEYIGLQFINTAGMFLIPLGLEMGGAQNEMTFRIVNRNMLSVFLDAIKTNAPSNSGIVGIGTFIMLPIVITALLIITSRVLNRNTSIR